ncbi:hypothetical protein B566_EDAN016120 [Ephemera danica]|nr:hypothetical protein B566_EDAN016120 [Ephemera danica]
MDLSRILFMWTMSIMISFVCVGYHEMEVNYDIGHYKFLHVNQTLELICKNLLNRDPPSWTYHSRLYNDPRMRFLTDVGESRLVITKARPGDADYDNKTLNPQPEEPGEDDYWIPPEEKVVVDKSEGRWTLRPYKGVNNAELIIADVTENDNGKYYCVARNLAGEQSKNCTVRVTLGTTGSKSIDKDNTANHEVRNPGEQREADYQQKKERIGSSY